MKKILISTDFSETAQNAAIFAFELALVAKASCTLVHAYSMPYDFASQMENRVETIRKNSEEKLRNLVHQLKTESAYRSLQIDFRIEEGTPERVIADAGVEAGADLIVIGLSRHSKWETIMAGNTGVELLDRSIIPVLAVPYGATFIDLQEFIYAAEFREEDLQNLEELSEWAKLFSARLRVIHIAEEGGREEKLRFRGFSEEVTDRLSYPYISQELIKADDVEEGILGVTSGKKGVVLAMAHYHKSWFKKMFDRSHTKAIATKTMVPLWIFFEKEGES